MRVSQTIRLLTHLGPRWAAFRLGYAFRRRTGLLERRTPLGTWPDTRTNSSAAKEVDPGWFDICRSWMPGGVGSGCVAEADAILRGEFPFFSHARVRVGEIPDWHVSPVTSHRAPSNRHWTRIGDASYGDIKLIWELSRFSWAFVLARAYAVTGKECYAGRFWEIFEDWARRNPPNCGPNWMCGQEVSFRLFAAVFARGVLRHAPSSTPDREALFRAFVRVSGQRIAANLDYALSQANNHGISECVGLITASRWSGHSAEARRWRRLGLGALREQVTELVYPDGGFAQHSANYHRVLLHDLTWCLAEFARCGEPAPDWLRDATQRAWRFLDALMTGATGRVPLYGSNDGANVLPLSDCEYLDFRPTVQATHAVLWGERRLAAGPWDEAALWLAGPTALSGLGSSEGPSPRGVRWEAAAGGGRWWWAAEAGCLIWWHGPLRLFLRCPTRFRHRPCEADLLHVDVEWRGEPVTRDSGSYSYDASDATGAGLKSGRCHNGVLVDDREPMQKAGRFLYLPWPRGAAGWVEKGQVFEASHDGYSEVGVLHSRRVSSFAAEGFMVEDCLEARGRHRFRVHWMLADVPFEFDDTMSRVILVTQAGRFRVRWDQVPSARANVVRADAGSPRGWWSPHYRELMPTLSLEIEVPFDGPFRFRTWFEPA